MSSDAVTPTAREIVRRFRVLDMMLSAHAILRDRLRWRAAALDLALLAVSIGLCATALLDPTVLDALHVNRDRVRIALGTLSVAAFFLSLVQWRIDWKEMANEHADACGVLTGLKSECREWKSSYLPGDESSKEKLAAWFAEMDRALRGLRPIPDTQFTRLKALHRNKVETSRLLDKYPAAPLLLITLRLTLRSIRGIAFDELETRSE